MTEISLDTKARYIKVMKFMLSKGESKEAVVKWMKMASLIEVSMEEISSWLNELNEGKQNGSCKV